MDSPLQMGYPVIREILEHQALALEEFLATKVFLVLQDCGE